jgi:hypothetical protein
MWIDAASPAVVLAVGLLVGALSAAGLWLARVSRKG